MFNKKVSLFSAILLLLVGVSIGLNITKYFPSEENGELDKFEEAYYYTKKYYLDEISSEKLIEDAINGMFKNLDPHTVYIPPVDQNLIDDEFTGQFGGIGIEFTIIDDTINVVTAIKGGPSEILGIQSGDRIIEIENESAIELTNRDVMMKLRGKKGEEVNITIYRPSTDEEIEYNIIRDEIALNSVDAAFMITDSIGYVRLSKFSETSSKELETAFESLLDQGMKNLLFDLRDNPGGYLYQAQEVADFFLTKDKLIVYTQGRDNSFDEEFFAEEDDKTDMIPLIVLVNEGSASASEIVAGAVQDWDRGLVVGTTTYGKGLVQRPVMLDDKSAIRLTIAKYFTPSGRAIQKDYSNKKLSYLHYNVDSLQDGENYNHTSEADTTIKVFTTKGGRKVYEKGGITPDYIVHNDSISVTTVTLLRKNLFYKYVRSHFDNNELKKSDVVFEKLNFNKFYEELKPKFLSSFYDFITYETELSEADIEKSSDEIEKLLKAYLAREIYGEEAWFRIRTYDDRQIMKSISLFDLAQSMLMNY
ncbi:MAG: S41 family peptidase [Melioribacteraceae bacterium]|nr:S41 family peptidase [Melioribacteraceae bacterium]MDD3557736.1 S41 family peptidase [Melioribacteraceae bacterium]